MRVAIVGSRGEYWIDQERARQCVHRRMDKLAEYYPDIHFISGQAPTGVDLWAEEYAAERGWQFTPYPADWRPNGVFDKSAGHKRNRVMATDADLVVLFWEGTSPGSRNMRDTACSTRTHLEVIFP